MPRFDPAPPGRTRIGPDRARPCPGEARRREAQEARRREPQRRGDEPRPQISTERWKGRHGQQRLGEVTRCEAGCVGRADARTCENGDANGDGDVVYVTHCDACVMLLTRAG
eukprot:gene14908-23810_t